MKILFISQCPPYPIYRDGATLRVHFLLQEFSKFADCYFLSFTDNQTFSYSDLAIAKIVPGESILYRRPRTALNLAKLVISSRRYYSSEMEKKIKGAVQSFEPDIIFCEQTFMAQYGDLAPGIPKVMSAVDAISLAAVRQSQLADRLIMRIALKYISAQRRYVEKHFFPKFDAITAVSPDDADYLASLTSRQVGVVPNGVATDDFQPSCKAGESKRIIFSGNLSAPMNEEACLYTLQHLFPYVHEKIPEYDLTVIGRSPTEAIRAQAQSYVRILADVADMSAELDGATLYISPISCGAGIKNNVLQAMAMAIPVLVTPLIARPIDIKDGVNGFVAERGDDMREKLRYILHDKKLLGQIGEAGRAHVLSHFSWQRIADQYRTLFQEICAKEKGLSGKITNS